MATTTDYIKYVMDQISTEYRTRYRKMFGEYMVYINDKPILLVCDNTVYVKMLPEIEKDMIEFKADKSVPYKGSKEHYILPIDDRIFSNKIISILEKIISVPKKKNKLEKK